jgi:hypothetical protein
MLSLMLDLRFKILRLIGHKQGKEIVEKYDKKSSFPMLLKCYYHLHPMIESKGGVVDERVEKDMSLDIFEMTTNTSEPTTELVNRELLIFRHYQVDVKYIKCPLQWCEKHESMFPTIGFCVNQIIGIVGSQIEIERIFSLVEMFTSHRRCHLQSKHLNKLIFVSKNWPNDSRIGCKSPSSLVDFIESNLNLEEELEEFEGAFQRDEVVELISLIDPI